MTIAIYPGSFDPITNGHLDIIERGSRIFSKVVVTVLENPRKKPLFSIAERLEILKETTKGFTNVEVDCYQGLLVDYVTKKKARIIIKGLRAISDFEFELQMAHINRKLSEDIETIFLMTNSRYSYLSSSIVKEVACYGGSVEGLVPPAVYDRVMEKYNKD